MIDRRECAEALCEAVTLDHHFGHIEKESGKQERRREIQILKRISSFPAFLIHLIRLLASKFILRLENKRRPTSPRVIGHRCWEVES